MTKKPHPSDTEHLRAMPKAIGFMASLHVGMGQYEKSPQVATVAEARTWGTALRKQHQTFSRALIYLLLPNGRQVYVPSSYQPEERANVDNDKPTEGQQPAAPQPPAEQPQAPAPEEPKGQQEPDMTATQTASNGKKSKKAAKTAKAPKAPKTKKEPKEKKLGKRAAIEAAAKEGKLPTAPDFSADTHARFREKLKEIQKLVKEGDIKGLKAYKINPVSTSPKAMDRYRNLCVMALEAQKKN